MRHAYHRIPFPVSLLPTSIDHNKYLTLSLVQHTSVIAPRCAQCRRSPVNVNQCISYSTLSFCLCLSFSVIPLHHQDSPHGRGTLLTTSRARIYIHIRSPIHAHNNYYHAYTTPTYLSTYYSLRYSSYSIYHTLVFSTDATAKKSNLLVDCIFDWLDLTMQVLSGCRVCLNSNLQGP
jgi:hypothetical protein